MKVTYDPETDTLTIRFNDSPITESDEIQEGIIADMDVKGRIIGLEILAASELVAEPQNIIFESGGRAVAGVASSA
jgi:uncharacterized protein YuzE